MKFVLKEPVIPAGANKGLFLLAPFILVVLALAAWAVIPVSEGWAIADINVGILFVFAVSSLQVYGVIMGGWASNSKYAFLGALRSAAQMVSYEVSIGFVIITVLLCVGSLNLTQIVLAQDNGWGILGWFWLPLFPMFVIFLISALAETNRPPFDLPEAESELVAGFNGGIFLHAIPALHARRIRGHHDHVCADDDPVPRRLAVADPVRTLHLGAGSGLVHPEDGAVLLHVRDDQGLRAALPL